MPMPEASAVMPNTRCALWITSKGAFWLKWDGRSRLPHAWIRRTSPSGASDTSRTSPWSGSPAMICEGLAAITTSDGRQLGRVLCTRAVHNAVGPHDVGGGGEAFVLVAPKSVNQVH